MDRYAVVIDGYHLRDGDNRGFASAFRARGVRPVTVLSTPEPLAKFVKKSTWYPEDFDAVHFHDGDMERTRAIVAGYDPVAVVPGNERGVELAAELVEQMMPELANVPGSAVAHRHKGAMAAALERAGVPGPRTICTDDPEAVRRWIAEAGLTGQPLVLKPPHSAGTDNVHLIRPAEDWRPYFDHVLGQVNGFELRNDTVVMQEFLEGPEYIVDLYSAGGRHGLVDTCRYAKHDRGARIGIYDYADFLPPEHPDVLTLGDYTVRAAEAVGIRNGSTHAEVIATAQGPRLVELAARYSGSCMMLAGAYATGDNQIDRTVRHVLDGGFDPGFRLVRPVRAMWLCAEQPGAVVRTDILERLRELPTVWKASLPYEGKHVPMTNDVTTALGWVILGAPGWDAIEADYRRIRELEQEWNDCQPEPDGEGA
jgi:biotin carboxylase